MVENPLKKCPFCGKEVKELGQHIANIHPTILDKLEEGLPTIEHQPQLKNYTQPYNNNLKRSIQDILREKIELIMDLKVLDILSKSPDASLQDLSKAISPPTPEKSAIEQLRELKEVADMFSREGKEGNDWTDVALHGMPILREMISDTKERRKDTNANRTSNANNKRRTVPSIRPVTKQDPGDQRQPRDLGKEPGRTGDMPK